MIGAAAALALFGAAFHLGGPPGARGDVFVQHYRVAGWRLEVRNDRFTGKVTCTIARPDITYSHGLVDFRFDRTVDTANAIYRVDYGVVHTAGSVAVEAAGLGAHFDGPNLSNPSNGEVHIPLEDLGQGLVIIVKPNSRMNHRVFKLNGLSDALAAARARSCDVI